MGIGSAASRVIQNTSPSRSSGKGGIASPAPQQSLQSQYTSPLAGLGAIYGGYQQPNPYAAPFQQRYVQQFYPEAEPFVPQSAENYRSPLQQIVAPEPERRSGIGGKGGKGASPQPIRGEQTYFDLTRDTTPPAAPAPTAPAPATPAPTPDPYEPWLGAASGGTIKAAAGRYLQGPGDGTSDSIPATIGNAQPARLADGEFVIDARTVSEIGNGSSNAGARKLYAMMERVHRERKRAKRGQNSNADRFLPR